MPKLGSLARLSELVLDGNNFGLDGLLTLQDELAKRKNLIVFCMGPFKGLLYLGLRKVGVASALAISEFNALCLSKGLAVNFN